MVLTQPGDQLRLFSLCILSGCVRIAGLFKDTQLLQLLVQLPAQPLCGLVGFSSISKKSPGGLCLALRLIQSCGRQLGDSENLSGGTRCAGLLLPAPFSKPACTHLCLCGRLAQELWQAKDTTKDHIAAALKCILRGWSHVQYKYILLLFRLGSDDARLYYIKCSVAVCTLWMTL